MPRAKDQYLAQRRAQILAAATIRFARDGFHRTSMADVIGEAGLSPGAVYRYFHSKDEIIEAIAADAMGVVASAVEQGLAERRPLPEIIGELPRLLAEVDQAEPRIRLAVQTWGEVLRNPILAAHLGDSLAHIQAALADRIRQAQSEGEADRDLDPVDTAQVLLALTQGFLLQHAWNPEVTNPARFGTACAAVVAGHLSIDQKGPPTH